LGPFVSDKENEVFVNTVPGAVFTTLHFSVTYERFERDKTPAYWVHL
jgi:hypothetical protein